MSLFMHPIEAQNLRQYIDIFIHGPMQFYPSSPLNDYNLNVLPFHTWEFVLC